MQIQPNRTANSPAALTPNLVSHPLAGTSLSANPQLASFAEHLKDIGSSLQSNIAGLGSLAADAAEDPAGIVDILETSDLSGLGDAKQKPKDELRDTFQDFVGQTFFSEMIKSLRSTQKGAAYFNGGRAEEIFQGQFDQMMTEHLSESSAQSISDPMYKLFQLSRKQ